MKNLLNFYKGTISFLLEVLFGKGCRFSPTCSEYTKTATQEYGILKGSLLAVKRLARCHPLSKPGYDPVPGDF